MQRGLNDLLGILALRAEAGEQQQDLVFDVGGCGHGREPLSSVGLFLG
jgi:hypothetical protein